MEAFIYDYYGYNISITNNEFDFQGYKFVLINVNDNEEEIIKLNNLVDSINNNFRSDVVYIVKNKYGKYISTSKEDGNICLLSYKIDDAIDINHFVKLHLLYYNKFQYKVNIEDIIILLDQRLEYIQNQCLVNLNLDNDAHLLLYEYTLYAIGLALNSLQYLSDIHIDFTTENYNCTLTHRRIKKMDKYELFNPFNFIIDHSSRDLAELYKNNLISYNTLMNICSFYSYNLDEYEYLFARLLYPTFIFDIVEDIANDNSNYDYSTEIYYAIAKQNQQLDKIKVFYENTIKMMNLRPIDWIMSIVN
jgi:hypothetical protein